MTCPVCNFITCKKCQKPEHVGSCDGNQSHTIAEAETYKRIISCTCGLEFIKDGGCNHMTCKRCKKEWCWVCKGVWSWGHICKNRPRPPVPRPFTVLGGSGEFAAFALASRPVSMRVSRVRNSRNLCSSVFNSGGPCRFRAKIGDRCGFHRH